MNSQLTYQTTPEVLQQEFDYYKKAKGKCTNNTTKNEIIKFFQQDSFFAVEKELFNNPDVAEKIINNRVKYLNKSKEEITDNDILTGFKKSGMHYGYSHFSPLLFKWFINEYNIKTCLDPFGGWGHRLLGALNLDKYTYNDLSYSTCCGIQSIVDYFNITNTEVYNEDAKELLLNSRHIEYEAIFTCPPYVADNDYNIEHYECGDMSTEQLKDYLECMEFVFDVNDKCKVMGIVIREDMMNLTSYTKKINLNVKANAHLTKSKKYNEYLYIWEK